MGRGAADTKLYEGKKNTNQPFFDSRGIRLPTAKCELPCHSYIFPASCTCRAKLRCGHCIRVPPNTERRTRWSRHITRSIRLLSSCRPWQRPCLSRAGVGNRWGPVAIMARQQPHYHPTQTIAWTLIESAHTSFSRDTNDKRKLTIECSNLWFVCTILYYRYPISRHEKEKKQPNYKEKDINSICSLYSACTPLPKQCRVMVYTAAIKF